MITGWLSLWLALRASGFIPDGATLAERNITASDGRAYVQAVLWPVSTAPSVFWCEGMHGPQPECFLGIEGKSRMAVFGDLPQREHDVPPDAETIRHFSFAAGSALSADGGVWLAIGCERPGSASAICVQRIRGGRVDRPSLFAAPAAFPHDIQRIRLLPLREGGVAVLWQDEGGLHGQSFWAGGETRGSRVLLRSGVTEFDAVTAGDRIDVLVAGEDVRLVAFDVDLQAVTDTVVSTSAGARDIVLASSHAGGPLSMAWRTADGVSVAIGGRTVRVEDADAADELRLVATPHGTLLIWSERERGARVIRAKGVPGGETIVVSRTAFTGEPPFFAATPDALEVLIAWRETPHRDAPHALAIAYRRVLPVTRVAP